MAIHQVRLNPSAVARSLGAVALLLVLASIAGQFSRYLLGHGRVYGLVDLFTSTQSRIFQPCFLCCYSSVQLESTSIHEKLILPVRELLDSGPSGIFYFAWVIPAFAVVFVLELFFLRFLVRLPARTRSTFMVAATLFLGGALGLELVGGSYSEWHGQNNLTFSMLATVEESLEMAGLYSFARCLNISPTTTRECNSSLNGNPPSSKTECARKPLWARVAVMVHYGLVP